MHTYIFSSLSHFFIVWPLIAFPVLQCFMPMSVQKWQNQVFPNYGPWTPNLIIEIILTSFPNIWTETVTPVAEKSVKNDNLILDYEVRGGLWLRGITVWEFCWRGFYIAWRIIWGLDSKLLAIIEFENFGKLSEFSQWEAAQCRKKP